MGSGGEARKLASCRLQVGAPSRLHADYPIRAECKLARRR